MRKALIGVKEEGSGIYESPRRWVLDIGLYPLQCQEYASIESAPSIFP